MSSISNVSVFTVIVLLCLVKSCYNARILASVPTPSYSHQVAFRSIWKELAKRGHEIVLMTTDLMEPLENIRQIDMSFSYDIMKREDYDVLVTKQKENPLVFIDKFVKIFKEIYFEQLKLPEVQTMIHNKSENFDLIMVEVVFPIHLGLAERFKVPVIGLSSLELTNRFHRALGNPAHPVLHPDTTVVPFLYPLTFLQRIITLFADVLSSVYGVFVLAPELESELQKIFGENCRSMMEIFEEIDMIFMNVNPLLHSVRALTPNSIQFGGGAHVENTAISLPKDLKNYLDNATHGVIYFSLGSNIKSYLLSDNLKQVFVQTLSQLPYKVLWKFETENLPNKPDNVWISKWFPQSEILKHSNIKLFITQCGLQSMEEAIMNHVPLLGIPFFGDQPVNGIILERRGLGVRLDYESLTTEILEDAIEEVIHNSQYKENVIRTAELITDVEMTGLEKVVWWTEYVIRNKGAKAFRSTINDLPFYQYFLLDVIAFVALVIIVSVFITKKILALFINWICRKKEKNKQKKN